MGSDTVDGYEMSATIDDTRKICTRLASSLKWVMIDPGSLVLLSPCLCVFSYVCAFACERVCINACYSCCCSHPRGDAATLETLFRNLLGHDSGARRQGIDQRQSMSDVGFRFCKMVSD